MTIATNLGWPRFGARRELKKALESHWAKTLDAAGLEAVASGLRRDAWRLQRSLGLEHVPSNDFSFYDHVLDQACAVGAVPARFGASTGDVSLETTFAMARGREGVPAMEMTKWFDTNYHYIVPEIEKGQRFSLRSKKVVQEFLEAKSIGVETRPVLVGPVSFLLLSKSKDPSKAPLDFLADLLPVYEALVSGLARAGARWIQVDEPFLALDLSPEAKRAFATAYPRVKKAAGGAKVLVASYFEGLRDNADLACSLPVDALHVDLVRGPDSPGAFDALLRRAPKTLALSLGVVDGRNVWRADLERALAIVEKAVQARGSESILVAPSCSLLHVPVDLDLETGLDAELQGWLAFAKQKVEEVVALSAAASGKKASVAKAFEASARSLSTREGSPRRKDPAVRRRTAAIAEPDLQRASPYPARRAAQRARTSLPPFPTTTIGSFPQTDDVRRARADRAAGRLAEAAYDEFLRGKIAETIRMQEEIGLDVLVHGEFERNDMVEHFGERLKGFAFTRHGWVQSYGSRLVKPPILYGDVSRPAPMTVSWSRWAQSLTSKPVKGMLTGPVTILQWSFVRDDIPRDETCRQIALSIRDETKDLEAAGLPAVQIDEPAIREGLPLRAADRPAYLRWAVDAFRLSSSGVSDRVQVHTHMCYSEFNEMVESIARMDADVISIESSRSGMELLSAFSKFAYPNEVGPGVYDIHSPRVPDRKEMEGLLEKALSVVPPDRLWVNPDCGLKTRRWEEVLPSLRNLVAAAKALRARHPS